MTVLFLSFLDQTCPNLIKLDQTWSNLIKFDFLTNLKMLLWKVVTFTERIKMAVLFLIFFWIRYVQNGSNLIKLDFLTNLKILLRIKMAILFLIFLDQICPKWIKLDQTWSNWISSPIWRCYYEKLKQNTRQRLGRPAKRALPSII